MVYASENNVFGGVKGNSEIATERGHSITRAISASSITSFSSGIQGGEDLHHAHDAGAPRATLTLSLAATFSCLRTDFIRFEQAEPSASVRCRPNIFPPSFQVGLRLSGQAPSELQISGTTLLEQFFM